MALDLGRVGGGGGGGGGNSGFQVTRMIEWGHKSKPKLKIPRTSDKTLKIPGPKFNPKEIPCQISRKH